MIIGRPTLGGTRTSTHKTYIREPQVKRDHPSGDPPIMFRVEVVRHLNLEHDNAYVVSLKIINTLVKKILIDTRSFVNIMYYNAFQKISLTTKDLQTNLLHPYHPH